MQVNHPVWPVVRNDFPDGLRQIAAGLIVHLFGAGEITVEIAQVGCDVGDTTLIGRQTCSS